MKQITKKRNPLLAAVLTLLGPGVGFLYVGRIWYALVLWVAPTVILAGAGWSGVMFTLVGFYVTGALVTLIVSGGAAVAATVAGRAGDMILRPYQRWYVYVVAVVLVVIVNHLLLTNRAELLGYETFRVPSRSMSDTLVSGDFLISNTRKYRSVPPKRGDVVIFRFPPRPSIKYVKRVIGLPGDVVEMRHGSVYMNGRLLQEPYVNPANNVTTKKTNSRFVVPNDAYFVLGDNRDHSNDSRYWGFVPKALLYGNVEFIWFSYDHDAGIRFNRIGMRLR